MNAVPSPLRLGSDIRVRLRRIGAEQQPLMVVDDVLAEPDALIAQARRAEFYAPEHTHYPGRNAPLPEAYYRTVIEALRGPLEAAFGLSRSAHLSFFGFFGLATTAAADAEPVQKIPHHDAAEPDQLAWVHYLARRDLGGTGFFRHRATGFESVDVSRAGAYAAQAAAELAEIGAGLDAFAGAQTPGYALIDQAEPVFNRLIVYRGHVLHSALLGAGGGSPDPAEGRLTANGFMRPVRPFGHPA